MKLKVTIKNVQTVNNLDFYWKAQDYVNLLKEFNFPDADKNNPELLDLLLMAITDFEPAEAANIVLTYKLSEELNEGQIDSISHEMLKDKIAEEYREPALHFDLYNINQLLHKAYNGKFPNTEATIIDLEIIPITDKNLEIDNEILLKALVEGLKDNNLIKRLFEEQLNGNEPFGDAAKSMWHVDKLNDTTYQLVTSNYWIAREDFLKSEYETEIVVFLEEES